MRSLFSSRIGARSTNQKIFFAALTVALVGMLAKGGVAAKELIVAKLFGRGDELDAFLISFLLPSFLVNLLIGALGSAFVPVFVETREKHGAEAAQKLFSSLLLIIIVVLVVMAALLGFLATYYLPFLGSNFSPAKLLFTRRLLWWLLPFIIFNGVTVFISAVLNAGEKFAFPALVPLITPLITILLLESAGQTLGVFSLVAGVVAGSCIESAALIWALSSHNLSARLRWHGMDEHVRRVLSQYAPAFGGSFLMCSTTVVDQAMAAMLPAGSVAALSYSNKLVGLILAVCGTALSTATLPYFSKMVAKSDWQGCRHTLKKYSFLVMTMAIPCTMLLMLLSKPLIRLLFQRGAFTNADTALVSHVQVFYAIQIPFYIGGMLFVRFLSSIKRNDVLMYSAALSLVLDVALNFLLMRFLGIAGIALSTSLVYIVAFVFLGAYSRRLISRAPGSTSSVAEQRNNMVEATEIAH
jgi:putative peptidoglycan lipid II flippase